MKQYLDMCRYILEHGEDRPDRTGTGTRSVFGYQTRYDLREGFPLLTTKKMYLRPIAEELLWFIKGDTNIKYLVDRNVKIWNEWPYEDFKKSEDFNGETLEEFVERLKKEKILTEEEIYMLPYGQKLFRTFKSKKQQMQVKSTHTELPKHGNLRGKRVCKKIKIKKEGF